MVKTQSGWRVAWAEVAPRQSEHPQKESNAPCQRQTRQNKTAKDATCAASARGFLPCAPRLPAPKGCLPCECECTRSKRMRRRLPSRQGELSAVPAAGQGTCARLPGKSAFAACENTNQQRAPEAEPRDCTNCAGGADERGFFVPLFERDRGKPEKCNSARVSEKNSTKVGLPYAD